MTSDDEIYHATMIIVHVPSSCIKSFDLVHFRIFIACNKSNYSFKVKKENSTFRKVVTLTLTTACNCQLF